MAESDLVGDLGRALRRQAPRSVVPWLALVGLGLVLGIQSGFPLEALLFLTLVAAAASASTSLAVNRVRLATAIAEALLPRLVEAAPPGTRRVILVLDAGLVLLPSPRQLLFWMFFTKDGLPVRPHVEDLLRWTRTLRMIRIGFVLRDHGPEAARARLDRLRGVIGAGRAAAVFLRNRKENPGPLDPEWSAVGKFAGSFHPRSADALRYVTDDLAGYLEDTLRSFRETLPSTAEGSSGLRGR